MRFPPPPSRGRILLWYSKREVSIFSSLQNLKKKLRLQESPQNKLSETTKNRANARVVRIIIANYILKTPFTFRTKITTKTIAIRYQGVRYKITNIHRNNETLLRVLFLLQIIRENIFMPTSVTILVFLNFFL